MTCAMRRHSRPGRRPGRRRAASAPRPSAKAVRSGDGIVGERGLAGEVALLEADHPAAAQVDRRQDRERGCQPSVCTVVALLARYNDSTDETTGGRDGRRLADTGRRGPLRRDPTPRDAGETERFFRDLCTLNELRDMSQRWAVVRLLDEGKHYAEISRDDRRQHRDDHPHRLVAAPRRRRLSGMLDKLDAAPRPARPLPDRRPSDDARTPAAGRPEQGPDGRADPAPAPRRRPRLRRARPQPRRARPELRPGHPVRAHQRHHRVRRRRRRRPRHHRHRPADRDRRRAAARPRARLRPLPPGRRRAQRQPAPDGRGPGRPARRHRPPEHGPSLLRRAGASRSTSCPSRARSRSRRAWAWPRPSSTSCRPARRWS